jgi:transposase-like protein
MNERKTRKHPSYTIDEKNKIVELYLSKEKTQRQILRSFDIVHSQLDLWVKQYRKHGTCVDRRGKGTKKDIPNKGRPKKLSLDIMSKEELLKYIKSGEDIKKAVAYLRTREKNTKS